NGPRVIVQHHELVRSKRIERTPRESNVVETDFAARSVHSERRRFRLRRCFELTAECAGLWAVSVAQDGRVDAASDYRNTGNDEQNLGAFHIPQILHLTVKAAGPRTRLALFNTKAGPRARI